MDGIKKYHLSKLSLATKYVAKDKAKKINKQYEQVFQKIQDLAALGKAGSAPLTANYGKLDNGKMFPIKEGLFDPDDKTT